MNHPSGFSSVREISMIPTHTPHQHTRVDYSKDKFKPEEDEILRSLVLEFGPGNWNLIASKMPGRVPRQCRERWNNYANPELHKEPWTEAEDQLLEQKYSEYGSRWKLISSFFPNRGPNNVKNRWLTKERRAKKAQSIQQSHQSPSVIIDESKTTTLDKKHDNNNQSVDDVIEQKQPPKQKEISSLFDEAFKKLDLTFPECEDSLFWSMTGGDFFTGENRF